MLVLAAVLWFFYLVPSLRRKREYEATERNATRLAQTLRVLSQTVETPHEVVADLSSREVRARRQELQRMERERELRARSSVRGYDVGLASRRRRTKLMSTGLGFVSAVTGITLAVLGLWVGVVVAALCFGLAVAALVALNSTAQSVAPAPADSQWEQFVDETGRWTPRRVPAVRTAAERQPAGAGLVLTPEVEVQVAAKAQAQALARQAVARAEAQAVAAQAAQTAPSGQPAASAQAAAPINPALVDDRFAAVRDTDDSRTTDTVLDISAALRARRSS